MPTQAQVWECDHCEKLFKEEDKALAHEEKCKANPLVKHCSTCNSLTGNGLQITCSAGVTSGLPRCYCSEWN